MNYRTKSLILLIPIALVLAGSAAAEEEFSYVGTKNCKKCHLKEWKSWSQTGMAQTYDKLKPGTAAEAKVAAGLDPQTDYTTDENCVRCHVTGYGKPGGFVDIETTPDLAGVGCEMCHGPGGTYTQDDKMSLKNKEYKRSEIVAAGMVEKVSADQCVGCHNPESPFVVEGYVFDFEEQKTQGTHESYPLKYNHD